MAEDLEPRSKAAKMSASLTVGWFRNDLRLRDNPMLEHVLNHAKRYDLPAILIYILDPRFYDKVPYGRVTDMEYKKSISTRKPSKTEDLPFSSRKCNGRRARFYLNVLRDLQRGLKELGTDLWILHGKPEDVLKGLQDQYGTLDVVCLREPVSIEWTDVEDFVEEALKPRGGTLTKLWGAMNFFHEDDLPFKMKEAPKNYSALANACGWTDVWSSAEREAGIQIRKPLPAPTGPWVLQAPSTPPNGALTDAVFDNDHEYLKALGFTPEEVTATMKAPHGGSRKGKGGETAAWARFTAFMEKPAEAAKKDPNFKPLGASFGAGGAMLVEEGAVDPMQWKNLSFNAGWTQLSKYMACGCITAREMYHALADAKHWALPGVIHRFMWREWYRINAIKHHRALAWLQGPGKQNRIWKHDPEAMEQWKTGNTGIPYIDACMRELNETGWLAYKGRKTLATFLVHDLRLDWRFGAFHMEEVLLDYDFAMNYGNWGFCARVDKDYGGSEWYDSNHSSLKQMILAEAHNDPEAAYVKQWVPEVKALPTKYVHTPWMMPSAEAEAINFKLGRDYAEPLVPTKNMQFHALES